MKNLRIKEKTGNCLGHPAFRRNKAEMFTSRMLVFLLALCMTAGLTACGGSSDSGAASAETTASSEASAEDSASDGKAADAAASAAAELTGSDTSDDEDVDKSEIVHAKADASGQVTEITVTSTLKNPGDGQPITDRSDLTDIKNSEGDEEYTFEADGTILWDNHGEDISYEGTSSDELPVGVKITYWLDDQEISPEDLAGKSGKVKIRFDYENYSEQIVHPEDSSAAGVHVPFVMITAAFLDEDVFDNVEVTNGELAEIDDTSVIIGYGMPGLAEDLGLADWEPTEEVDIPDYMEFTADVTDFSLDFTATIATNGLLGDIEEDDLDDIDELVNDMKDLSDASTELVDGTQELVDGMKTYRTYLVQYQSGVSALDSGIAALNSGMKTLNSNKSALAEGADGLSEGLDQINQIVQSVDIPTGDELDEAGVTDTASALASDIAALTKKISSMQVTLQDAQNFVTQTQAWYSTTAGAVAQAKEVLSKVNMDDLEASAESQAKSQAKAAVEAAMKDMDLTEEQKSEILKKIDSSISLDGVGKTAEAQVAEALKSLETISEPEMPDLADLNAEDVLALIQQIQTELSPLGEYSSDITDALNSLGDLADQVNQLQSAMDQLTSGSKQLSSGIKQFNSGIGQVSDGIGQLKSGSSELSTAMSALIEGFDAVLDGSTALSDGFSEFDEEGIQKLTDLAGDDLAEVLENVRALRTADKDYQNFSGIADGQTGSVTFLIETDEIG